MGWAVLGRRRGGDRATRQEIRAQIEALLAVATGSATVATGIALAMGERALLEVADSSVFETRLDPGYWAAGTKGVPGSAGGVRLDVGRFGGNYVAIRDTPTVLDRGRTTITDRRVVFAGTWYRREWLFPNITGVTHFVNQRWTVLEASDRDTAFGFTYDHDPAETVRLRLAVAGALYDGQGTRLVASLRRQLATVTASLEHSRSPLV